MEALKMVLLGLGCWILLSIFVTGLWAIFVTRYKRKYGIDPYSTPASMLDDAIEAEERQIARARAMLS